MLTQEMLSGERRLDQSPVLRSPCSLHQAHRSSNMLRKKTLEVLWSGRASLRSALGWTCLERHACNLTLSVTVLVLLQGVLLQSFCRRQAGG